jgi:tryptophan-rich sensory protein
VNPTILSLIICTAAAVLEGALAGSDVRQRLAELRMPPYSPPFALWLVIGAGYYAICFIVLRHLLVGPLTPAAAAALVLLALVLLGNASWSVLFFRWRDLRASFIAFIPYALLIAALAAVLASTYPVGAALFLCYGVYLVYGTWWGYRLWLLNTSKA